MLWASDEEEPLLPPPPMDVPGLLPPVAGAAGEAAAGGEAVAGGELAAALAMAYPPPAATTAMTAVTSAVRARMRSVIPAGSRFEVEEPLKAVPPQALS